jgi:predicted acetyltransferase
VILRELTSKDQLAYEHMLEAWDESPGFNMLYGLIGSLSFESILRVHEEAKLGINLKEGDVPATSLYAFIGDQIVGKVSVRHELNDYLRNIGGHIGYGVLNEHRGKGYASQMLEGALGYCRSLGLSRVLVTCDENNLASRKVIEKNGGVLENFYDPGKGAPRKMRFWITI